MNAIVWPLAVGAGLGLTGLLDALWPRQRAARPDRAMGPAALTAGRIRAWAVARGRRLALAGLAATAVWVFTGGWIADTIGAGLLVYFAPVLFGDAKALRAEANRSIAVAAWTESVRSAMTGSAGLEQALAAAATVPPPGLETPVREVAAAVREGQPVDAALARFGRTVDNEIADRVVFALVRAWRRGGDLTGVLARLSATARDQARATERLGTSRTSVRTSLRHLTVVSLVLLVGLTLVNPILADAFDTTGGQLLLAVADLLWAVGAVAMVRLGRTRRAPRLIAVETETQP